MRPARHPELRCVTRPAGFLSLGLLPAPPFPRRGFSSGEGTLQKRPLETVPGHRNGCRRGPGQPSIASVLPSYAENVQSTSPDASAEVRPAASRPVFVPAAKVGLSTSSVYPESTSSAFELARRLFW